MIFYIVILIPLFLYGAAIAALTAALFRKSRPKNGYCVTGGVPAGVSVIIPFRNEEHNLPALVESLKRQCYKGAKEVIFVNDGSEDNGVGVIKENFRADEGISVKIVDLRLSGNVRLTSKQQALDLGVAESSHPLLLFTDADMVLAPDWAESLVRTYAESGAELVFGHTSISQDAKKTRLFTMLEAYQLEFLFAFAYAFSKLNLTGSCMGNNLLVVKDAYIKCGGQRGAGYNIVEDRALLELLRKNGFMARAAEPFRVTAKTLPSRSFKQFSSQTARWARGGLRPESGLFAAGLLLLAQNSAVFLYVIQAAVLLPMGCRPPPLPAFSAFMPGTAFTLADLQAFTGFALWAPASLAVFNFLLTWVFTAAAFKKTASPAPILMYPAYYVFMMAETIIFVFSLIFGRKIEWKGRTLMKKNKPGARTEALNETAGRQK